MKTNESTVTFANPRRGSGGWSTSPWLGLSSSKAIGFTYSSAKFNEMFGYTATEVLGLGPLDTVVESDHPLVAEQLRRRLDGSAPSVEYVFRALSLVGCRPASALSLC